MRRILALFGFLLGFTIPAATQDAASFLLPRINNLRANQGLPAYSPHAALKAAASNHARWLANTGEISHYQPNGSGPRSRAVEAGFPSNWVSENIYRGASPQTAWQWWLNSPIHYAGIVSPNYDKIGIGSASGAHGNAYVLVFGNSTGRLPEGSASAGNQSAAAAPGGPPSYVLGLDEFGNIKHEVQPGQTIGHILLIYGYTWDEYPQLLALNGMSEADRLNMQPGSVLLVPPQAGTYTPAPPTEAAAAAATETETEAATETTSAEPSATPIAPSALPSAPPTATAAIRIRALPSATAPPMTRAANQAGSGGELGPRLTLLGLAILVQLGIIGAATIELIRRAR